MIRYIDIAGDKCPADISIMTTIKLAKHYGIDITGIQEKISSLGDLEDYLDFVVELGVIVLNDGARREGIERRYTTYDLQDILTADLSIAEALLANLLDSFSGDKVFSTATETAPSPKKKDKRSSVGSRTSCSLPQE